MFAISSKEKQKAILISFICVQLRGKYPIKTNVKKNQTNVRPQLKS